MPNPADRADLIAYILRLFMRFSSNFMGLACFFSRYFRRGSSPFHVVSSIVLAACFFREPPKSICFFECSFCSRVKQAEAEKMLKRLIKANEGGGIAHEVAAALLALVLKDVSAFQPATRH
jgi:hypothetical protein